MVEKEYVCECGGLVIRLGCYWLDKLCWIKAIQKGKNFWYATVTVDVIDFKREACLVFCIFSPCEHPSDTQVFTVKMEILLEPTSKKLLVANELTDAFGKPFKLGKGPSHMGWSRGMYWHYSGGGKVYGKCIVGEVGFGGKKFVKGQFDRGTDDTTNQFSDDVQDKKADVEMTDAQQEKENLKITQEQVVEDDHVTITTVAKESEVHDASVSHSFDLASKFLNFSDMHPNELPRIHTSTLLTVPVLDILEASPRSRQDKDKDEGLFVGSDRGFKKRNTSKDAERITSPKIKIQHLGLPKAPSLNQNPLERLFTQRNQSSRLEILIRLILMKEIWNEDKTPQKGLTQNWLLTLTASTSTHKPLKDFDELMSTPIDLSSYILNGLKIENLTQEILLGPAFRLLNGTRSNYAELKYDFEECYKALSEKLDWENPKGGDYPFDLSKPLPLIMRGNRQSVPVEFFINNDLKYLQGRISTMKYTTSTTNTMAAHYDLLGIEDMVPNIWSPVKVAYDKYALCGISHWREQCKSFYAYARGKQSRGDVYSTNCILAVTHVLEIRKHGYEYLEEIVNRLINLSGVDVADFVIALRMFTRSLVIQKKRHPYTPYKDPQGFIYIDDYQRNRLLRSDELYKFSDGTLTSLLSLLEDITKNIDMEYLPKRR
nr:hypothetical protein [Tanacetum cinerariifolium]